MQLDIPDDDEVAVTVDALTEFKLNLLADDALSHCRSTDGIDAYLVCSRYYDVDGSFLRASFSSSSLCLELSSFSDFVSAKKDYERSGMEVNDSGNIHRL